MYQIRTHELGDALIRFNDDGTITSIPFNGQNSDYRQYEEWLAEGNEPEVVPA